jgi:hypothetical protein
MYTYDKVAEAIRGVINPDMLQSATISAPVKKGDVFKIKIRPIVLKGERCFQLSKYIDTKVVHENCTVEEVINRIVEIMHTGFKQCVIAADNHLTVLMNKKGEFKLTGIKQNTNADTGTAAHNEAKNYILKEGQYVEWMYKLGLMDKNGIVLSHKQKKFRQINRFLEMLRDVESNIPNNSVIVDMGCGKSYLTFAMYHYFNIIKQKNITIKGFDLKADVVSYCNGLTDKLGFDGIRFYAEDIADIDNIDGKIAMIITLHACDTATDIALYHGIRWGCKVIMSVPCCQHELYPQLENQRLDIILKHGILRERFASVMTDAIRAKILELKGYKTSVMEFIDMEHTPKNIMIRAVKGGNGLSKTDAEIVELERLLDEYHIHQKLYDLCFGGEANA